MCLKDALKRHVQNVSKSKNQVLSDKGSSKKYLPPIKQ
jgi:hypothetical protein